MGLLVGFLPSEPPGVEKRKRQQAPHGVTCSKAMSSPNQNLVPNLITGLIIALPNRAGASQVAQPKRIHLLIQETWVQSLGQEAPLEKEMATHSHILAWEISWTEEPGRLHSVGSQKNLT